MNRPKQHRPVAVLVAIGLSAIASTLFLSSGSGTAQSKQARINHTPASTAETKQTAGNLPTQKLPVPGWLGFATVPADSQHRFPWSPSHRDGQLVIFSDDWAKVKPGTRLVALAPKFKQNVSFQRSAKEPYGCDGIPTTMASFSSQTRLIEGPVWILPSATATNATAVPVLEQSLARVPTSLLPANQRQSGNARAWIAGQSTILLQKQGQYKVKLTMAMNNRVVYTQQAEKYSFGEAGKEPVKLSLGFEPGIPQPIGAFQFKAGQPPVLVLWIPGYEGNSFDILAPQGNSVKRFEIQGMYFCAY